MGSLLDVDSSFFSLVALNATGYTSGVEVERKIGFNLFL
jgi:hypothetical protein